MTDRQNAMKEIQERANSACLVKIQDLKERGNVNFTNYRPYVRLRSCKAGVVNTDNNESLLYSYGTLVAIIDYNQGAMYDILRWAYGYTATSAQHISKFFQDYGNGCMNRWTWREC